MLVVKKLLYRILQWMAQKDSSPFVAVTAQLANSNVMSDVGSRIWCYHLFGQYYLISAAIIIRATQARTDMAAFRFRLGDKFATNMTPWYQLCLVNSTTFAYSYCNSDGYWFNVPGTWNANAIARWSIFGIIVFE